MENKELKNQELLEILKEYFEKRDDVLMAFLFGSYAKATTHKESDVDIAVYCVPLVSLRRGGLGYGLWTLVLTRQASEMPRISS